MFFLFNFNVIVHPACKGDQLFSFGWLDGVVGFVLPTALVEGPLSPPLEVPTHVAITVQSLDEEGSRISLYYNGSSVFESSGNITVFFYYDYLH